MGAFSREKIKEIEIVSLDLICTLHQAWPKEDFLREWAARCPGTEPDESLLRGVALLDDGSAGAAGVAATGTKSHSSIASYRYFPRDNLSRDIKVGKMDADVHCAHLSLKLYLSFQIIDAHNPFSTCWK